MEEHSNFLSHADVVEEKSELECRVESLNTELSLARDLQHSQEAALAEAMLKMELLEAQVKELMIDCSVLRKEVSDLRTDSQHQQVEVKEEEMKHVYNEVHQRNCYLETKVAELEKMLECANTRPASACESSVGCFHTNNPINNWMCELCVYFVRGIFGSQCTYINCSLDRYLHASTGIIPGFIIIPLIVLNY